MLKTVPRHLGNQYDEADIAYYPENSKILLQYESNADERGLTLPVDAGVGQEHNIVNNQADCCPKRHYRLNSSELERNVPNTNTMK